MKRTFATIALLWMWPGAVGAQDAAVVDAGLGGRDASPGGSVDASVGPDGASSAAGAPDAERPRQPDAGPVDATEPAPAASPLPAEAEPGAQNGADGSDAGVPPDAANTPVPVQEQDSTPDTPGTSIPVDEPKAAEPMAPETPTLPLGSFVERELPEALGFGPGEADATEPRPAGVMILLLFVLVVGWLLRRTRRHLPESGALPAAVSTLSKVSTLGAIVLVFVVVDRLLPPSLRAHLPEIAIGLAVAIAWAARDVLPDLAAGAVLTLERRVRKGVWVQGEGIFGRVEQRGLRATLLRDGKGDRITVPNRALLGIAIASQGSTRPVHDVTLRLAADLPATDIRRAIEDAALISPWTSPDANPVVRRDGTEPSVWYLRAQLLDVRFATRFEGELLERTEEILTHRPLPTPKPE